MRVLVTGGAGFLGSHLVRRWVQQHPADEVVNLDVLSYAACRPALEEFRAVSQHRFVQGDVADLAAVESAMAGCELVVHCAAETHVDRSIVDAAPFVRTNIAGTQVLLDCARRLHVKRFLHLSTDEVYGPIEQGTYAETAALHPRNPYAASKAAADLLVQVFHDTYGLSTIIVRSTNVFGPWQFPEKLIPVAITSALQDRPLPIYGDGRQRRSWLFIDDFCRAIDRLVEAGQPGGVYNLPSPWESTNAETATRIVRLLGKSETLIASTPDRPAHDRRYAMDGARMAALGWRAQTSFDEGLQTTVDWYRRQAAWWQPLVEQLHEHSGHWLNRTPGSSAPPAARARR